MYILRSRQRYLAGSKSIQLDTHCIYTFGFDIYKNTT